MQTERASADSQSFVEGCSTHVTIPNVLLFRLVAFSTDFLYFCLSASFVYFQIFDITSNVGTRPALALVQRILILSGLVLQPEIAPCAGAIVKWLIIFMDRVKACRAGLYLSSTFLEILASCWFFWTNFLAELIKLTAGTAWLFFYLFLEHYRIRGERIVFSGPNTNTNTIRVKKFVRIGIQILFGLRNLSEYEYEYE